jgi:hypothetical protein
MSSCVVVKGGIFCTSDSGKEQKIQDAREVFVMHQLDMNGHNHIQLNQLSFFSPFRTKQIQPNSVDKYPLRSLLHHLFGSFLILCWAPLSLS